MKNRSGIPAELITEADRIARKDGAHIGEIPTAVDGLTIFRAPTTTAFEDALYQTVACLVLQGEKEIVHGTTHFNATAGTLVLVSHDLPVLSRITQASEVKPYLAVVHRLDIVELRALAGDLEGVVSRPGDPGDQSLGLFAAEDALVSAFQRYLSALGSPDARAVLIPLIRREIAFRLMTHEAGAILWKLIQSDSCAGRIARAIAMIRSDIRQPASVSDLAEEAGMSPSVFHESFKKVTALTPLQYGKTLRLARAKDLLSHERLSVAETAFAVGYESPTQFSRDFSRRFGIPPRNLLTRVSG